MPLRIYYGAAQWTAGLEVQSRLVATEITDAIRMDCRDAGDYTSAKSARSVINSEAASTVKHASVFSLSYANRDETPLMVSLTKCRIEIRSMPSSSEHANALSKFMTVLIVVHYILRTLLHGFANASPVTIFSFIWHVLGQH